MKKCNRAGGGQGSRFFLLIYISDCNGRVSLILSEFRCCVVRSFECHGYSRIQRVSFGCSFCKSSCLHSEIRIEFAELFVKLMKPSGRNPFSYLILESKVHILRLKEQTSPNLPYAWVRAVAFDYGLFLSYSLTFISGVCSVTWNKL